MQLAPKNALIHLIVFISIFAATFLSSIQFLVSEKKEVKVPPVVGKSWLDVSKELADLGLKAKIREKKYHFFAVENTVIEQSVPRGDVVPEGREISLDISLGKDPDWKKNIVSKPYTSVLKYLREQNITYTSLYHLCSNNPSDLVVDVSWEPISKKMNILLEDQKCHQAWVIKDVQKAKYISSFREEIKKNGMEIRTVGNIKNNDNVVTDPKAGSIVNKGEFIVIRKE